MRSIETLVNEYPDKTGHEILLMQEADKLADEKRHQKANKGDLALIKKYNEEGAYFKSTFGTDQYRYDKFENFRLVERQGIVCDVESIVGFFKEKTNWFDSVTIERKSNPDSEFDSYMPQAKNRITKDEYEALSNHIDKTFVDFWGLIDLSQFN